MKKTIILLGLLAGLSASAVAETLWVYGVSEQCGWYDANKSGDNDSALCWAAVSSNLLNWWQSQYVIPDNVPTGDAVWDEFRKLGNERKMTVDGLSWWLVGDLWGQMSGGGYYSDKVSENDVWDICLGNKVVEVYPHQEYPNRNIFGYKDFSSWLYTTLNDTENKRVGIGLEVGETLDSFEHGITLWGAEFDASQNIIALWLTDSDDKKDGLFKVGAEEKDGRLYLSDYFSSARYVSGVTVLDAMATDEWRMQPIYLTPSIPEPATVTLSLLALSVMASRRRRE